MPKGNTFIIDLDDFSSLKPGEVQLTKMKEHFPDFKVTLFTTPFDKKYILNQAPVQKLYDWGKLVEANKDWMEIAVHGFAHERGECMVKDKKEAEILIKAAENVFKKIGVSFVKIFKAPFWEMNEPFEQVLHDMGYVKAIDRNNPIVHTDIPTYTWSWSIETPIPDYHTVKGHGHVVGTNNGIDKELPNLLKLPIDTDFQFISEYLEENGIRTTKHNSTP